MAKRRKKSVRRTAQKSAATTRKRKPANDKRAVAKPKRPKTKRGGKAQKSAKSKQRKRTKSARGVKPSSSTAHLKEIVATAATIAPKPTETAALTAENVVVKFTKHDDILEAVRITLYDPEEVVLNYGEKSGQSRPRAPGKVDAFIEVKIPNGAGGTAVVETTNLTVPSLSVTVPKGQSGRDVTKTLTIVSPTNPAATNAVEKNAE